MPTPQRLPIVNSDDGVWGDILRQYLAKEHFNDDTDNAINGGHQKITIQPGTASAGTAPLKFTTGTLLTTPEAGAMEFAGDNYYLTDTSGPTRRKIAAYDDTSGATGDIYYRNSSGYFTRLGIGSTGNVLTVAGGIPSWSSSISNTSTITLKDTNFTLQDDGDTTKQLKFELTGIATGTTRTWSFPNADSAFVGTNTAQTLTNKTIQAPTITDSNGATVLNTSGSASAVNYITLSNSATTSSVGISATGSDTNLSLSVYTKGTGAVILRSAQNGIAFQAASPSASSVNYIQALGAVSGSSPTFQAVGSDTNINLVMSTKGTGVVLLYTGSNIAFRAWAPTSSVNYIQANGSTTGVVPSLTAGGTDTNVGINLIPKGTGTVQANGVDVVTTTDTQTLTNKTLTSPKVNTVYDTNGNTVLNFTANASAVNYVNIANRATTAGPIIKSAGSDTNIDLILSSKGTSFIYLTPGGSNALLLNTAASAVNYVQIVGQSTGNGPQILAMGADTNIHLTLSAKGTGVVKANGIEVATITGTQTLTNKTLTTPIIDQIKDTTTSNVVAEFTSEASAVNYLRLRSRAIGVAPSIVAVGAESNIGITFTPQGNGAVSIYAATGQTPTLQATGVDTNHDLKLLAKGSGTVRMGSSVTVPNGNLTTLYNTADETTNYEKLTIRYNSNVAEIGGYVAGTGVHRDLRIGINNSTYNPTNLYSYAQFSVASTRIALRWATSASGLKMVSIGGGTDSLASASTIQNVLAIEPTVNQSGTAGYTGLLINPTETATGSGTKLLIDAQVGGVSKFSVDNTGVVTMAAVGTGAGSVVTVDGTQTLTNKTLTSPKIGTLYDNNGAIWLSVTPTASAVNYVSVINAATGGQPYVTAVGADTNISLSLRPKGTGSTIIRSGIDSASIALFTGVTSAVNRIDITNSATGLAPTVSAAGSDTNVTLKLASKGVYPVVLMSNSSNSLVAYSATGAVNYLQIDAKATGTAPILSAVGGDTNIGLNIVSKGTGTVQANGVEVATISGTQTLTNKTLTNPKIQNLYNPAQNTLVLQLNSSVSAVNYLALNAAAAGASPTLGATGTDANIGLNFAPKGTGKFAFYVETGQTPAIQANGVDTNHNLNLISKGTGTVQANGNPVIASVTAIPAVTGTPSSSTFLRGDGTWSTPTGGSGGMLAPCQGMTVSSETFTISSGSVTQVSGTTINGYTPAIGDRILIINAPATTGVGSSYATTFQPTNGIYVVTGNTTNLTVTRASDMSGSNKPNGMSVHVQNATWPGAWTLFFVEYPNDASAFTWGTTGISFKYSGGIGGQMQQVWLANNGLGFNVWNGTGWTKFSAATNAGTQTLTLPATATSDTLVGQASTDTLTNKTLTSPKINQVNDTNGNTSINLTATSSAVNYVNITNTATGSGPSVAVAGSDTNIDLNLDTKGSGSVYANGDIVMTSQSLYPLFMDSGRFEPFPQILCHNNWALNSGDMPMTLFTPTANMTVSNILSMTAGGTSSQSGATACKVAIFRVDDLGVWPADMTCIARSANKADRWNGALLDTAPIVDDGAASPNSISSVNLTAGQMYAVGFMSVGHTGSIQLAAMGVYRPWTLEPHIGYFGDGSYSDIPVNLTGGWIEEWTYVWFGLT